MVAVCCLAETGYFVELVDPGFGCCSGSGSSFRLGPPFQNFCFALGSAELTSRFQARELMETVGPNGGCA